MPETRISQAQKVLEEHKVLHGYLDKMEAALSALPPPGETSSWLGGLASLLQDLLPLLKAHFALEEDGGFFEEIEEAWPHTARACARLREEHGTLLERFERLRAETEAGPSGEEALQALVAHARSLLKDLAHHEETENDLLFRSLDDAVAAQD